MRPTPAPPALAPDVLQAGELKPALLVLIGSLSVTLLLLAIGVFDVSVLSAGGSPRAELVGSALAGALAFLITRQHLPRAAQLALLFVPPLAATSSLAFEALSLVLCPSTFELAPLWAPLGYSAQLTELQSNMGSWDLVTGIIAGSLSLAGMFAFVALPTRDERTRFIHALATAVIAAGGLMLLIPVASSSLGTLPLPPNAGVDGGAAAALPRTGLICLPIIVATLVFWSMRRNNAADNRFAAFTRRVSLVLTCVAVGAELLPGRSSLGAIVTAVVLATLSQLACHAVRRRPDADGTAARGASAPAGAPASIVQQTRVRALLTAVFFFSGMAALLYQVVFAKGLALTFGSTSHASTIVLATYMGGLALGSWTGGKWASRLARPVLGYAIAELGIAAICSMAPLTLQLARKCYVAIASGADPSEPWLVGLQLALGAVVLVPPTWLMGLTLPLLTRQFLDERSTLGRSAGLLYTANTAGAAAGACLTGYLVLPALGVSKSLFAAVLTNVLVALFAIFAARGQKLEPGATPKAASLESSNTTSAVADAHTPRRPLPEAVSETKARQVAVVATLQLAIGGFVTFGLETTFVHLLATVAGTSAYAFSLMLFAFLIGLSLGASFVRRKLPTQANLPLALLLCQLVLATTLLVACRYWDYLPAYFALFGRWPYTLTFAAREFVRFVVCLFVMLPPAICIGAQFPIAMEAVGYGWPTDRVGALGRASALNTLGNIVGALVIGFVTLPYFGSHRTLALLTMLCLGLATLALTVATTNQRRPWGAALGAAMLVLVLQPPQFDLTRLASGGNVYFKPQYYGRIIDHTESLDGGLTAVAIAYDAKKSPIKTLLTNGKFQGNDRRDGSGEMVAQASFALAPLLHTTAREKALVIGFGTGTTTRVLDESGFRQVSVAELSGDIVALADRHFSSINQGVIHRPNVSVHVTDGRNFLLLDRQRYDVISIELSSIWFAGAANLYNHEFYALLDARLTEQGILQQWVQLHRLSHRDIMSILVTLHRTFPRVWLYFLGKQGILVACKHDCAPTEAAVRLLETTPRLGETLAYFPERADTVLRGRMLTPDGMERLIEEYEGSSGLSEQALLSTDDNLYLEYSTPKGNVREYDESIADNEAFLARFRAGHWLEGTRLAVNH